MLGRNLMHNRADRGAFVLKVNRFSEGLVDSSDEAGEETPSLSK